MKDGRKKQIFSQSTIKNFLRVLLRSIPFIPAPEIYDIIEGLKRSRVSMDEKIKKAYDSLQETSNLISDLEIDLKERTRKLLVLREECDRYSKLAEVEEEKVKALLQQLEFSLSKGKARERWVSFAINLAAGVIIFIIGILASPMIRRLLGEN